MTALLLWMVVSSLNIFTIGILTMSLKTPITQIMAIGPKFDRYKDKKHSIIPQQLCYLCLFLSLLISLDISCLLLSSIPTMMNQTPDFDRRLCCRFVALQLIALGVGLYKCLNLGLLPNPVDWFGESLSSPV